MKWRRDLPERILGALVLKEKGHRVWGGEVPSTLCPWRLNTHILHIQTYHSFSRPLPNLTHVPPWLTFLGSWGMAGHYYHKQAEVTRSWLSVHKLTRLLTNSPFQYVGRLGLSSSHPRSLFSSLCLGGIREANTSHVQWTQPPPDPHQD